MINSTAHFASMLRKQHPSPCLRRLACLLAKASCPVQRKSKGSSKEVPKEVQNIVFFQILFPIFSKCFEIISHYFQILLTYFQNAFFIFSYMFLIYFPLKGP